jgi:hypothetical protein
MRGLVRAVVGLLLVGLVVSGQAGTAAAGPTRSWPVTPGAMGSLYGSVDPAATASLRVWGSAVWCYAQPTADADVAANLDGLLGPSLDQVAASGGGTAIVTIGHPAPWVFDNHPRAVRPTKLWSCGNHASSVSIPSPAALRPNRDGTASVQAQRWAAYVAAVVDWVRGRYPDLRVILEAWNEPNLSSGLNPGLRIPGAARTAKDAATSLYLYEKIAKDVIVSRGAYGPITLGSSALFTRPNTFSKVYLAAQNKRRVGDSIHFNIYGFNGGNPTSAVVDWDRRAAQVRSRLNKYKKLRSLPLYATEANVNLVNRDSNRTNLRSAFTSPDAQRRMAAATVMNAYFHGFQAVYWLIPWRQQQAGVFLRTTPGNVARDALAVLNGSLVGRQFVGCRSRGGVRTCTFVDPATGNRARVVWRNSGTSKVSLGSGEILEMTGAVRPSKGRETIGTTPIVIR